METLTKTKITIEATVNAPIEEVWSKWTRPEDIVLWNNASDDWHTPYAKNDLKVGGKFVSRMEARDGSSGFDFSGIYSVVRTYEEIAYTMDDGRKAEVSFKRGNPDEGKTIITETFEAETENSEELQRQGWQAILDNFKQYCETKI